VSTTSEASVWTRGEITRNADLIRRVIDLHQQRSTSLAPAMMRVDVASYTDPAAHQAEVERVFRRWPLPVAHRSQLDRPGSYFADRIVGVPVVVVRNGDGGVQAFINVCRHRGTQLVAEGRGRLSQRLSCPYHGWSYDFGGNLRVVPDEAQSFPGLDAAELGLVRVDTQVAGGWVWVSLDEPIGSRLAALRDEPEVNADGFVVYTEERHDLAFNWKVGVESFLENYHFAYLHRDSTNPLFIHNLAVVERWGPHVRVVAPKKSMIRLDQAAEDTWSVGPHATIVHTLFPSTCLFVEKNHHSLVRFLPTGIGTTSVRIVHVVRFDQLSYRDHWDKNIELFMSAVEEDFDVCESIQAGLASGANSEVVFGRNELGLQHFRTVLERAMADGDPEARTS
jgi:phenylpropionate dioxygenase-like ring-hydroxylating dioxygenase large terminal subunit